MKRNVLSNSNQKVEYYKQLKPGVQYTVAQT